MTGRPRLLAMVARTDCQLMRLPRAEIVRLTESEPQAWRYFALLLMRNYGTVMSVVHALKQSDPARRVAAMLVVLIEGGGEGPIEAIASQTDIGELANLGRSMVSASLRSLEELGLDSTGLWIDRGDRPERAARICSRDRHAETRQAGLSRPTVSRRRSPRRALRAATRRPPPWSCDRRGAARRACLRVGGATGSAIGAALSVHESELRRQRGSVTKQST